jgi:acetyltransferase-like isoleucine patch superfamily enzyme
MDRLPRMTPARAMEWVMKRIVTICKGGFGGEMQIYLREAYPEGSGYVVDRVMDLFPDDDFRPAPDEVFVVANGEPRIKAALVKKIEAAGGEIISMVHPTAYVAPNAIVGKGAILCPFAFVAPFAELEPHVTINVHGGTGHNSKLASFVVLSPYASVSGAAELASEVFMGTHSYVAPLVKIGARTKISTGAFAITDIGPNCLAVGNPARVFENYFS